MPLRPFQTTHITTVSGTVLGTSDQWNSAYTTVNAKSGRWDSTYSTFNSLSSDLAQRWIEYVLLSPAPNNPYSPTIQDIAHRYLDLRIPNGSGPSDTYVVRLPNTSSLVPNRTGSKLLICGEMLNRGAISYTRPFRIEAIQTGGDPPLVLYSFPGNPSSSQFSWSAYIEHNAITGWSAIPFPNQVESKANKNIPDGYAGLNSSGKIPYTRIDLLSAKALTISSWERGTFGGTTGYALITTTTPHNLTIGELLKIQGCVKTGGSGPNISNGYYYVSNIFIDSTRFTINFATVEPNSSGISGVIFTGGIISPDDKQALNSVYTTTNSDSGKWNSTYTTVNTNSAGWESAETTLSTNSAKYNSVYTTTNSDSGKWNSTYTTVNTNSAGWESAETTLSTNSATWQSTYTNFQQNSGYYDAAVNELFTYFVSETGDEIVTEDDLQFVYSNIDGYPMWNSTTETVYNLSGSWITTSYLATNNVSVSSLTVNTSNLSGLSAATLHGVVSASSKTATDYVFLIKVNNKYFGIPVFDISF